MEISNIFIDELHNLLPKIGKEILTIREKEIYDISLKKDGSFLTECDILVNNYLISFLKKHYPEIPILSEESLVNFEERKKWDTYFIIDPIDGTKHFVQKDGDFTIQFALIEGNEPIFGIIYNPLREEICYGIKGNGVFLNKKKLVPKEKNVNNKMRVVVNKSFDNYKQIYDFFPEERVEKITHISSSYKFVMLAKGKADAYIRFNNINIWDIAPGDIIVKEMGFNITDIDGTSISYRSAKYTINGIICKRRII